MGSRVPMDNYASFEIKKDGRIIDNTDWNKKIKQRDVFANNAKINYILLDGILMGMYGSGMLISCIIIASGSVYLAVIESFLSGSVWIFMSSILMKAWYGAWKEKILNYEVTLGIRPTQDRFNTNMVFTYK